MNNVQIFLAKMLYVAVVFFKHFERRGLSIIYFGLKVAVLC